MEKVFICYVMVFNKSPGYHVKLLISSDLARLQLIVKVSLGKVVPDDLSSTKASLCGLLVHQTLYS